MLAGDIIPSPETLKEIKDSLARVDAHNQVAIREIAMLRQAGLTERADEKEKERKQAMDKATAIRRAYSL